MLHHNWDGLRDSVTTLVLKQQAGRVRFSHLENPDLRLVELSGHYLERIQEPSEAWHFGCLAKVYEITEEGERELSEIQLDTVRLKFCAYDIKRDVYVCEVLKITNAS